MDESGSSQSPEKDQLSTSPCRPEATGRRLQILVVEDSRADVYLIRQALRKAHIEADIQVVSDGQEATRFIDDADANENAPCPAVVLLDLNLPKKPGDDVLKHLRSSPKCGHAPVVIVTSSDAIRDREAAAALGVEGYFRKPSDYAAYMMLGLLVKSIL